MRHGVSHARAAGKVKKILCFLSQIIPHLQIHQQMNGREWLVPTGEVIELRCSYDPETKSGSGFTGRKPNGNIHYVDGTVNKMAEFRLFEDLILDNDDKEIPFSEKLNPNSLVIKKGFIEESMNVLPGERYQFTRNGYYVSDEDSTEEAPIFNRIVSLKSSFKPKTK